MKDKITCSFCGAVLNVDMVYTFDGKVMCGNCYEENTILCDCCGDRIWRIDSHYDNNNIICQYIQKFS